MRIPQLFAVIILLLAMAACTEVSSIFPVGENSVSVKPEEWNGKWIVVPSDDEFAKIEALPGQDGMLRVTGFSHGKEDKPMNALLRVTNNGWMFANVATDDNSRYYWALIRNVEGNTIYVWLPNFARSKKLVEAGTLPGETQENSVSLDLLRPEHLKIITEEHGVLFDWDQPLVLKKVDDKLKP
jgi:hypothetical protein